MLYCLFGNHILLGLFILLFKTRENHEVIAWWGGGYLDSYIRPSFFTGFLSVIASLKYYFKAVLG